VSERRLRNKVVMGAVAAAAFVGGGGGAIAATQLGSDKEQQAILDDAAQQLGVQPSELRAALVDAYEARIDAAVEAGDLTQDQADDLKARLEADGAPLLGGPLLHGPEHHGVRVFAGLDTAATYLGLSEDELKSRLGSGDTLAEIATAEGKTVDGLVQAMVDAAEKDIAAAVDDGRLTQSQADEILADLPQHIEDLVDGELPRPMGLPGPMPGRHWDAGGGPEPWSDGTA
jgi:hypothetical protein